MTYRDQFKEGLWYALKQIGTSRRVPLKVIKEYVCCRTPITESMLRRIIKETNWFKEEGLRRKHGQALYCAKHMEEELFNERSRHEKNKFNN